MGKTKLQQLDILCPFFLTALASVSDPQNSQTRHSIKQDPHD